MKEIDNNTSNAVEQEKKLDNVSAKELKKINDVDKIFEFEGDDPSKQRVDRLKEIFGYGNPVSEYAVKIGDEVLDPDGSLGKQVKKLGFNSEAYRHFGVFFAYLLGVKDMSFEQAIEALENENTVKELAEEYRGFALGHLPEGPDADNNIGQWVEMFKNCDKKMGQFKFPEVDYSKKEDVDKWKHYMDWVTTVQINVTQEYEMLAKKDNVRKFIPSDSEKLDNLKNWYGLNEISLSYKRAYNPEKFDSVFYTKGNKRNKLIGDHAAYREMFHIKANSGISGKTVSEVAKSNSGQKLYSMYVVTNTMKYNFKNGEASDYLKGKKTTIPSQVKEIYGKALDDARKNYNEMMYQSYNTFKAFALDEVGETKKKGLIVDFFAHGDSPQELCDNLKSEDMKEFRRYIDDAFNNITGTDLIVETTALMNKKPLDLIKIDGKSAYELWGDKYNAIKNHNDKEMLIKAEILKEMTFGKSEVTIDRYVINEKNEFKFLEPYKASKNEDTLLKEAAFFKGISNLRNRLCIFRDRLADTQKDKKAIFYDGKKTTGSDSYQKMANALKKCIDLTDVKKKGSGDYYKIEAALKELKAVSAKYYESHTGLSGITSGWLDNGKERINVSADIKNELTFDIETIRDLAYDINVKRDSNYIGDFGTFNLSNIWSQLKKDGYNKGVEISDKKLDEPVWNEVSNHLYIANRKDTLRKQLMRVSSVVTGEENMDYYIGGIFENSPAECAKMYYKKQYLSNIRKADTGKSAIDVSDIEKDIESPAFKKHFFKKVKDLATDKDFVKMVKEHPKDWYARWNEKVRADEKAKFVELAENNETYEQLLWSDPENAKQKWQAAEYRVSVWEREWQREKEIIDKIKGVISQPNSPFNVPEGSNFYMDNTEKGFEMRSNWNREKDGLADVLSTVLAYSFVKEQSANPSFMEIALDPKQFEDVKKYIKDGLKADLFSVKNNAGKMVERLNNIDALKMSAKQYVKDGYEAKKEAAVARHAQKVKKVEVKGPAMK